MKDDPNRSLMSIDVEDWFQVENLRGAISRESWDERELRVETNTHLILDILDRNATKATFFVLGWVAERLVPLVGAIHARGHEVACHGYGHQLLHELSAQQFRDDVGRSKAILEDITGEAVLGYRAPSFSITDWAVECLVELGFRYDSSLFSSLAHDRYGKLAAVPMQDNPIFELRDGFHQVRLSCLRMAHRNLPWAGGGYFRLMPYPVFTWGVRRILEQQHLYCFYIHPWEFDPGQPNVSNIRASHHFRHYNNLDKTESRFSRLVAEFPFAPIRSALPAG
jgi:polysaccharide deacetylase family protein (PEP-CTERM system associated)